MQHSCSPVVLDSTACPAKSTEHCFGFKKKKKRGKEEEKNKVVTHFLYSGTWDLL
jgi:hypothetical protein